MLQKPPLSSGGVVTQPETITERLLFLLNVFGLMSAVLLAITLLFALSGNLFIKQDHESHTNVVRELWHADWRRTGAMGATLTYSGIWLLLGPWYL